VFGVFLLRGEDTFPKKERGTKKEGTEVEGGEALSPGVDWRKAESG
jgi:hypothetical protein